MAKLVFRGIKANLGRLLLTLVSVVLGVSFVSGSFVLADSLRSIFNQITVDAFAGVDAQVRAIAPVVQTSQQTLVRFDQSVVDDISDLDEVEYAEAGLFAFEQVYTLDNDGEPNRPPGPPVFTVSWGGPSVVSSFTLVEGKAPTGNEIAIDAVQAASGEFELGDTIEVSSPARGRLEFTLVGLVDFGEGGTAGAYFNLFDLATVQNLLGAEGLVDSIVINSIDSVAEDDLLAAVDQVIPGDELEVVPADVVIGEQQEDFGSFITIFGNILLGFAIVVLFVSVFIIYNTFSILVGQRTQQIGLLRSVGASVNQVRFMVLFESVIIGVIASGIGLVGGLGVAWLLKQLFSTGGNSFPDGPLTLQPRTIGVVIVVGLVVTVLSALLPAIRASRVAPLEAVRGETKTARTTTARIVVRVVLLLSGPATLFPGLFADMDGTGQRLLLIGVGAALTFVGVAVISGHFASIATQVLGRPLFVALASMIGGLLSMIVGFAGFLGGGYVVVMGFGSDNFAPMGILMIVAGLIMGAVGYLCTASGVPTLVDGAKQLVGLSAKGPSLTLVNLARVNASRNPQRTAATSAALMIGLALITGVAVLTASILATFDRLLDEALTADLFVYEENQNLEFSSEVIATLNQLDGDNAIAGFRSVEVLLNGQPTGVSGFDTNTGTSVVNIGVVEGVAEISAQGIGVLKDTAEERGLGLGDTVSLEFEDGFSTEVTVEAIFTDSSVVDSSWVLDRELTSAHAVPDAVQFVGIKLDPAIDVAVARSAVEAALSDFPQLVVQDNTEFQQEIEGQIAQLQLVITGLLVVCLVVAFFGIVNTMALSVLERTREIGLLRAVGLTQAQLRSTIRSEAVLVSVFGAILGVSMGLLLGWAAVVAIPDSFVSEVGIPWLQLAAYVIVGIVIGIVAAFFPARRAANLNVLDAVSYE